MKTFQFDAIFQGGRKWLSPGVVALDDSGKILKVSTEVSPEAGKPEVEKIQGWAIPGFINAHSHAFQYAMSGLTEHLPKGAKSDDFWSWRELMYDIALAISPEELQAIAAQAFAEMVRQGFTWVTEFHYLHKDPKGKFYANPSEMGDRLAAAATEAGIQLTLVPVFYRWGDFRKPPSPKQSRFILESVEEYSTLLDSYSREQEFMGIGVHSLRAANPQETLEILGMKTTRPKHLHIAEQEKEVASAKKVLKSSPIDWLFDHVEIDEGFQLVHCTHATSNEIKKIAKSGANVILCPSTEGNLGDGYFEFEELVRRGGTWSIGTDSHIGLSPLEELRWLDYGTRLRLKRRNPLCAVPGTDSGQFLFDGAFRGGRLAATGKRAKKMFQTGDYFDAAIVNSESALLEGIKDERRLSTLLFSGDASMLKGTIVRGEWRVKDQRHVNAEEIRTKFRSAVKSLRT